MNRSSEILVSAISLGLCLILSQSTMGFLYPLQTNAVREAYFLGRTTDERKFAEFVKPYAHHFQVPDRGAHVESIEFRTPYEQVVLRSREHSMGYSAQDAEKDYETLFDRVEVRVLVYSTMTYPGQAKHPADGKLVWQASDFLDGFEFRVFQGRTIEPKKVIEEPICPGPDNCPYYGGYQALLEFQATQFEPSTARVTVTTPDGHTTLAVFDLNRLR